MPVRIDEWLADSVLVRTIEAMAERMDEMERRIALLESGNAKEPPASPSSEG